jgi:hypothetical protein
MNTRIIAGAIAHKVSIICLGACNLRIVTILNFVCLQENSRQYPLNKMQNVFMSGVSPQGSSNL